jgi:hypothetical protein
VRWPGKTQGTYRDQQGIRFVLPAPRLQQAGLIFLASFFASRLQHEVGLPAGRQGSGQSPGNMPIEKNYSGLYLTDNPIKKTAWIAAFLIVLA